MKRLALLLFVAGCEPDGPHWHRSCAHRVYAVQFVQVGKVLVPQTIPICTKYDSAWVDHATVPR
jgi:hypothetical protein